MSQAVLSEGGDRSEKYRREDSDEPRSMSSSPDTRQQHIPSNERLRAISRGMSTSATSRRSMTRRDEAVAPENEDKPLQLTWRQRIKHFTWTWFTMTMATGGIANVLYTVPEPYHFPGIYPIGCIFFILNIVLFLFNVLMMSLRFYYYPYTFRSSLTHPTESLFVPALAISFGTILLNISQYGIGKAGPWLTDVMIVLYWVDSAFAVLFSWGIFLMIWSSTTFTIAQMTPVWIFPAYPLLIIGPHAANLAAKVPANRGLDIIIGGFVIQGIGFMVSLMVYSAFIYRLMTEKLPVENSRPAMFISVGPSGFTIAGIVGMARSLPRVVPADFMGNGPLAAQVSVIVADWVGLWLWGLALWFFLISVGAHFTPATHGKMHFAMTWYSFIFPNTALTTATFAIGSALGGNRPIEILGCVMTIGLIIMWIFVFVEMIRSVYNKQILWPQSQEDRDEGGWNGLQKQKTWENGKRKSISENLRLWHRGRDVEQGSNNE